MWFSPKCQQKWNQTTCRHCGHNLLTVAMAAIFGAGTICSLLAQPPRQPAPNDFYFDNERYEAYSRFDDDQFIDYDDFYYDEYYEASEGPYDGYGYYDEDYEPFERPYVGDDGPYADYGAIAPDAYGEGYYDDSGYGGYARYGYGYEGFTYDYYDDLYTGPSIYDDSFNYGVDEGAYYTDDWYEEVGALERWYE